VHWLPWGRLLLGKRHKKKAKKHETKKCAWPFWKRQDVYIYIYMCKEEYSMRHSSREEGGGINKRTQEQKGKSNGGVDVSLVPHKK
jgi:hypothetical protein